MHLRSEVEQDVAHWILFVGFSLSVGLSFFALNEITALNFTSVSFDESGTVPLRATPPAQR